VNIRSNPDAAAYVPRVNNGSETVPTVVIDRVAHPNPPPGLVARTLAGVA
jgi:hypothetical protein